MRTPLTSGGVEVTCEIPMKELADFDALLTDIAQTLNWGMKSVISMGARYFCESAAKATRVAKTRRPVWYKYGLGPPGQENSPKARDGRWPVVTAYYQDKPSQELSVTGATDRRTIITRAGAARCTWLAMKKRFAGGGGLSTSGAAERVAGKAVWVNMNLSSNAPSVELINRLSYMQTIHPNILADTMRTTQKRLEYVYLLKLQKKMEDQFRTGGPATPMAT